MQTAKTNRFSPFVVISATLHASLFALIFFAPYLFPKPTETVWGAPGNKSVTVGVRQNLPGIPLPAPPVTRDDAKPNESKSLNPPEPAPKAAEKVEKKVPEKGAIKIPSRGAKPEPKKPVTETKGDPDPAPKTASNAIPGNGGQIALPYGQEGTGTGPATFGDTSFGTKYPWYVNAMINAIRQSWSENPALRGVSPRVYVGFTIDKNQPKARDVRVETSSGSTQLDNAALRTILATRMPPLPPDFKGSSVEVRFYFEQR